MTRRGARPTAVVLGAGIQGSCVALALRHAGWQVTMVDRLDAPLQRTSRRGEGKLHLGYVYANEADRSTAHLMIDGALAFAELIDRWSPAPLPWHEFRSTPFLYGVLDDSMVAPCDLAAHYAHVDDVLAERFAAGASYPGLDAVPPVGPAGEAAVGVFASTVQTVFSTGEIAIRPAALRRHLLTGLDAAGVRFRPGLTVHGVERRPEGFAVSCGDQVGGQVELRSDIVVNCLWDGRLAVDSTMGLRPPRPWVYRLKYGIHGRFRGEAAHASVALVLGPYGDVVAYAGGWAYASWYPACMVDRSGALTVPEEWEQALAGDEPPERRDAIARASFEGFASIVPAVRAIEVDEVTPCVIVAWGQTDIDDPDSELHRRVDIGVHDHDGYLSIDTGKLTTAPLFAERLRTIVDR